MEITTLFECKSMAPVNENGNNTANSEHCERMTFTPLSDNPNSKNHGHLARIRK